MSQRRLARSNQSRRLVRKLAIYAGALGVVGARGTDVQCAIIHTDFGPAGAEFDFFELDLDGNQGADFVIHYFHTNILTSTVTESGGWTSGSYIRSGLIVRGQAPTNRIVAQDGIPTRFAAGQSIGQQLPGVGSGLLAEGDGFGSYGPFANARGYLGLLFEIPGSGIHAAWADIARDTLQSPTLYGFAYETILGKPILAGDKGISPNVPGDTNADGKVDLADLNNVRNYFGGAGLGDTNADGTVDLEDLNAVRNNFGATSGTNPVPEPPSLVLLAAGAAGLAALRRKRAKHEQN